MNHVIIFAGGTGTRMKSSEIPKQFMKVNDKEILAHTIEVFNNSQSIDQIVLVVLGEWIDKARLLVKKNKFDKVVSILEGGGTAIESQFIGLKYLNEINTNRQDVVLIHDGVRPLIDDKLIIDNINSVKQYGSTITTSPSNETVVINGDKSNIIEKIVTRDNCSVAKAPQSFIFDELYETHIQRSKLADPFFIDAASMMLHLNSKLNRTTMVRFFV